MICGVYWALTGSSLLSDTSHLQFIQDFLLFVESQSEGNDILDFVKFSEKLSQFYSSNQSKTQNPVEIMTIHKAKGLEFDYVFIPGIESVPNRDASQLMLWLERPYSEGVDLLLAPRKANSVKMDPIYQYVDKKSKEKSRYEQARLLYVAITRAKIRCELMACVTYDEKNSKFKSPHSQSFLALLWDDFQQSLPKGLDNPVLPQHPLEQKQDVMYRLKSSWRLDESLARHLSPLEVPEGLNRPEVVKGAEHYVGTLIHRILCQIANEGIEHWAVTELLHYIPRWGSLLLEQGVHPGYIKDALHKVKKAIEMTLEDKVGRWILSSHLGSHNEWSLVEPGFNRFMNRVIDRAFIDETGIRWIIDYKTGLSGCVTEEAVSLEIQKYRDQLTTYAKILQKYEKRKINTALYFPLCENNRFVLI